jgi:hypothetical protein
MIAWMSHGGREDEAGTRPLTTTLVDLAAWQIGLGFALIGFLALFLSTTWEGSHGPSVWDSVLRECGSLLFVTATLSIVWDLRGRRQLTDELLAATGLSKAVTDAGLTYVARHYSEIDWESLLARASHIDLFFAYAGTWRANHEVALRRLVKREGARLRIILPDRDDPAQVQQLAARFGHSDDEVIQKVQEAERFFAKLASESDSSTTVELRATCAIPVFTYYRFDGRCVGVLYSHADERVEVPAFECAQGDLHAFFSDQFKALWDHASVRPLGQASAI